MLEFNFLIVCWFILCCLSGIQCYGGVSQCGRVHITVSSLRGTFLEMHWITDCNNGETIPEYIILSSRNVQDRDDDHGILLKIKYSDYPTGVYTTNVNFGHPWLPGGWEYDENSVRADPGPHCFPFWIASVKGNVTIDSRCLAIQPTWMSDNRESIGDLKISSMLIPGTHNSGSFAGVVAFLEDYVLNQDRSVWTQLAFGIRYLDFRIGYYNGDGKAESSFHNIFSDNPWLWHPLSQYWGDTTKVPALKDYIQKTINERNPLGSTNPNWALMAELTPRPIDIIFRRNGLRKLAHDANVEVTKWFRDQWGKKSNIVATDYFLGNDMINVAMSINSS
nr:uncharacterized protein LOC111514202 [Leptinotarsa decemlineata]